MSATGENAINKLITDYLKEKSVKCSTKIFICKLFFLKFIRQSIKHHL